MKGFSETSVNTWQSIGYHPTRLLVEHLFLLLFYWTQCNKSGNVEDLSFAQQHAEDIYFICSVVAAVKV
jgi:hypothetical protein